MEGNGGWDQCGRYFVLGRRIWMCDGMMEWDRRECTSEWGKEGHWSKENMSVMFTCQSWKIVG